MLCTKPDLSAGLAFASVLLVCVRLSSAHAQEPPLTIPNGGPPPAGPNALPLGGWQLYSSLNTFTQYSNNYFLSPAGKISGWSYGVSPTVTAEWSNGIHTTTLFGTYTNLEYLRDSTATTNSGEATITEQYAPLRDLNFTFLGDYTHETIAPSLTSGIPSPVASTATSVLPNGNTVLPDGTIVTPNGQVVGQLSPSLSLGAFSIVNPYDLYTAMAQAQKMFSDGIITLSTSVLRQNYEEEASALRDFTAKTFREDMSFWIGPLFYIYSDGSLALNDNTSPSPDSKVYRVVGGLGTRQFGLFRLSGYFGHQGSQSDGSPAAGGKVYGGTFNYYPTPLWTIGANLDVTVNLAASGALPSTQALNIPVSTPLQIPLSSTVQITTPSLNSEYKISPQWTADALFGYSDVKFLGTPSWEDAWFAAATLRYDIRRDLALTWQYQYASIVSDVPFTNATRNFISMSALYKF